jgi:hypothetical protein
LFLGQFAEYLERAWYSILVATTDKREGRPDTRVAFENGQLLEHLRPSLGILETKVNGAGHSNIWILGVQKRLQVF